MDPSSSSSPRTDLPEPAPESLEQLPADSLEVPTTPQQSDTEPRPLTTPQPPSSQPPRPKRPLRELWHRTNIYLLLFILLLILSGVVAGVLYLKSKQETTKAPSTITSQGLSTDALKQLANSGTQVGDPKQVLNIQSNTVFTGAVLVRGELQAAGGLKMGGSLAVTELNASGAGSFAKLQTRDLAVQGRGAFQGQLSTGSGFSASGGGSFGGALSAPQISTNTLRLGGSLVLSSHLVAGGPTPGGSRGGALGAGGTTSVSGSDTAGSINIHTGGGTASGCFVTVQFARSFSGTPRVVVTPVGAAGAKLPYYITRTPASFSLCTTSPAPSGQSFGFDYIALD